MTENDRALGRMEGKIDHMVDGLDRVHDRLKPLEDWQRAVEQKYAFGKGAAIAGVFVISSIGGFVSWLVEQIWSRAA